jgi:hypothetical protein
MQFIDHVIEQQQGMTHKSNPETLTIVNNGLANRRLNKFKTMNLVSNLENSPIEVQNRKIFQVNMGAEAFPNLHIIGI